MHKMMKWLVALLALVGWLQVKCAAGSLATANRI
jgi:hypothetical protein